MPTTVPPVVAAGTMAGRPQPLLQIDELTLRPWAPADAPALVAAYSDPDIQHWHARSMTISEEAQQYVSDAHRGWTDETGAHWAVTDEKSVLGRMSVRTIDLADGTGAIGYWVLPAARGRGVAHRALIAASDWALHQLGLHRLALDHSTRNPASCRVATKAGYVVEGTMREQALHSDGWHDMHLHSLLPGDAPAAGGMAKDIRR